MHPIIILLAKLSLMPLGVKQSPESIAKRVLKNTGQIRVAGTLCIICGKNIPARGKKPKFCSQHCKGIWMSRQTGENTPHYCGGNITKTCVECGKEYPIQKWRINSSRFCSQHCKGIWLVKNNLLPKFPVMTGANHPQWKGGDTTKTCVECGKEYPIKKCRINSSRFCSQHCKGIWRVKNNLLPKLPVMTGANNPAWKGGISFEPYCPKFTNEFKERVRAFFHYECLECGTPQNGEKLHVHHITSNKKSCCDSTIPLFIPLCRSCHGKTQSKTKHYQQHFTDMIQNYYQGKCYFSKEEMQLYNCGN